MVPGELSRLFNLEVAQRKDQTPKTSTAVQQKTKEAAPHKAPQEARLQSDQEMSTRPADSTEAQIQGAYSVSKAEAAEVREELVDQVKAAAEKMSTALKQPTGDPKGVLRLWDFGGQTEFYTTHHMFLESDAINIIAMDASKHLQSKVVPTQRKENISIPITQEEFLCYWLRSIEAKAKSSEEEKQMNPQIILVFTHVDMITHMQKAQFLEDVKHTLDKFNLPKVLEEDMYFVDNAGSNETVFNTLKKRVQQLILGQPTWGRMTPVKWLKIEADVRNKVQDDNQKHGLMKSRNW